MAGETKMSKCVFCGKNATKTNSEDQPVCKDHKDREPRDVGCPECGMPMKVKEGRYGYFWGCEGYPQCDKTFPVEALSDEDQQE